MVVLFPVSKGLPERGGHLLPAFFKGLHPVRMMVSKVLGFGPVPGEIVEFPWVSLGGDQFPVPLSQGAVTLVKPPEFFVQRFPIACKGRSQGASGGGHFPGWLYAREIENGRGKVDDMSWGAP